MSGLESGLVSVLGLDSKTECRVESPIDSLMFGITCEQCHPSFCKVRLKPARISHALRSPQETMAYRMDRVRVRVRVRVRPIP